MNEKEIIQSFLYYVEEYHNLSLALDTGWFTSELERISDNAVEFYIDQWIERQNENQE